MRCVAQGAHLISHRPCSPITRIHTLPLSSTSRGLLASNSHNINQACAPERETRQHCSCYHTIGHSPREAARTMPCPARFPALLRDTCSLLSLRQTTGGLAGGVLVGEAETSRTCAPISPISPKKGRSSRHSSQQQVGARATHPQIPGVWVSVPSRGIPRCAVPVRRAGSRRLAQSENPCGQTVTAADGRPGSIRDVRTGRRGWMALEKPHQQKGCPCCVFMVRARTPITCDIWHSTCM